MEFYCSSCNSSEGNLLDGRCKLDRQVSEHSELYNFEVLVPMNKAAVYSKMKQNIVNSDIT